MKAFVIVIMVSAVIGGFVGGELTDRTFFLTGAVAAAAAVGVGIFGLGAFFSRQDERKLRQQSSKPMPPDVRAAMGRLMAVESGKKPEFARATSGPANQARPAEELKTHAATFLAPQLLPMYPAPKNAFGALMTNRRAAGYVFGFHDALLQRFGLGDDRLAASALIEESYKEIFGNNAGYALHQMSIGQQDDAQFHAGRLEGGNELVDYLERRRPPLGLGRLLVVGVPAKCNDEPDIEEASTTHTSEEHFEGLCDDLQRLFHRTASVPAPEDAFTRTMQTSSIANALRPFAYGLKVMQLVAIDPEYIETVEHAELHELVRDLMVEDRQQVAGDIAAQMPQMPGGPFFQADAAAIRKKVEEELASALEAVAEIDKLRPLIVAKTNLLQVFISAAPFVQRTEQKARLLKAMSGFADDYLMKTR